jgi:acetoin utilization protein AcuB
MRVRELMTTGVVTIEATATCHDAMQLMVRRKVRHLPVVGNDGVLAGIVTDRDLRHHLFQPNVFPEIGRVPVEQLLSSVKLWEVMSSPVICVGPDAELEDAARMMLEDKLGSLPVVHEGRIVGIITETDLLRRIVGSDACCKAVESIVVSFP